jgi:hypothetical protein
MKLNARQVWLIAGLSMGMLGSSALAQVAPPPTQPKKEEPAAQPQAGEPQSQSNEAATTEAQPANRPARTHTPGPNQTGTENLPTSTPYPKLLAKDENGKIIRLTELPDILALRSNPTVGQRSVTAIMPVLYGRRARFERLVIDNLDLYWMVTDGRLETMDLNDIKNMSEIAEMIKPLVGRTTLSQELRNRGILTRTQAGMNEYIVNEYKQGITTEIQFESEEPLSEIMRFILQDSIHETTQAYRAMLAELSFQVGHLVKESELSSSAAIALAELEAPLSEDKAEQQAHLAQLDEAFRALSLEEGIELLTAMRNKRKNPDISPAINEINVMHDRKVDMSEKEGYFEGEIRYKDGRVVKTKDTKAAQDEKLQKTTEELEKTKEGKSGGSGGVPIDD